MWTANGAVMATDRGAQRLTKRIVDQADETRGRHYLWDRDVRGFGLQVEASGTKTYIIRYRPKGLGRDGPRRFIKLGRHGDLTAEQAREQAKIILGQVAMGRDPALERRLEREAEANKRASSSFAEGVERFMVDHATLKRKPTTAAYYRSLLCKYAVVQLGKRPADQITRNEIMELHRSLAGTPQTANRLVAVISSLYSFAAKRGLVPEGFNPARGIEKYREQGRERYLTRDELQRLGTSLSEAETVGIPWQIDDTNPKAKHVPKVWKGRREVLDPYAVAAIRLLLFTGARLREILHLRWEHVDLDRSLLFLPESKTGKKTIVLSGPALDVLHDLGARHGPVRQGFVIKGAVEGRPRADLKKPWRAIQRQAQLDGVRLHDLRHTFASIGAGSSLGLPIVGKLLGHSQPQTTARYAHLDADPLRRAANVIGEQLMAALNPIKGGEPS